MTLTLELSRRDLMAMVRGTSPSFKAMDHPLVKPHFEYCDHPQRERWRSLERLTEAELWTLYLIACDGDR
jgi:hypothetical protein